MGEQKKLVARKKLDKKHRRAIQKSTKYGAKKGSQEKMDEMSAPKSMKAAHGDRYSIK